MPNASEDERWMHEAVALAEKNPAAPFGAVIVDLRAGEVVGRGVNRSRDDCTMHGEIAAIRELGSRDDVGDRLTLYTTAEPCPMCAGACFWAGITRIVYGVSIPWLTENGWRQLPLRARAVLRDVTPPVSIEGGVLVSVCRRRFEDARRPLD